MVMIFRGTVYKKNHQTKKTNARRWSMKSTGPKRRRWMWLDWIFKSPLIDIDRVHLLCKLKFQQVPCFLSHNFSLLFNTLKEVEVSTLWRKLEGFKDSYSCQLFHVTEQLGKYSIHGAAGYWKRTPSFMSRTPSVSIYVATLTYISLSILTCNNLNLVKPRSFQAGVKKNTS